MEKAMIRRGCTNHVFFIPMVIVYILITAPLSTATENLIVDAEISRAEFDSMYLNITITNIDQKDIYLTGIEFSVSDPIGASGSEKWKTPIPLNKSITHRSKHSIVGGDPLKNFYRRGSANVTISGSVFVKAGSSSFAVPFHETATIFPETDGVNQAVSPNVTDITFEINRLTGEDGGIKEIITTTNISIYNPNTVSVSILELDCKVIAMHKKGEKLRGWRSLPGSIIVTNQVIKQMDTYVYNAERSITDTDILQYFESEEPKYIKIKGVTCLIINEAGWTPTYFECPFETVITTMNRSSVGEDVAPTSVSSPPVSPPPPTTSSVPGFGIIFTIACLLVSTHLLRRRN